MAEWAGENVESMKFGWFHGVSATFHLSIMYKNQSKGRLQLDQTNYLQVQ